MGFNLNAPADRLQISVDLQPYNSLILLQQIQIIFSLPNHILYPY